MTNDGKQIKPTIHAWSIIQTKDSDMKISHHELGVELIQRFYDKKWLP